MFDKIVIATDDSPIMNNAMRYTLNLFPDSEYFLISVVDTTDRSIPHNITMRKEKRKVSKKALKDGKEVLNEVNISPIEMRNPEGVPSQEIKKYADDVDADLLVMASHSKVGAQRVHIGETTLNYLKVTSHPSLIFPRSCPIEAPEKIFNPTTFSTYSVEATMIALDLADHLDASVTTFHFGENEPGPASRRIKKRADRLGVDFTLNIKKDASDKEIIERMNDFDFLIGSRGRKGILYKLHHIFPKLSLSSLEREVIAEGEIPILLTGD
ncbi:MAG: universal stress protein [Candidatus Natronoplasma sp.]